MSNHPSIKSLNKINIKTSFRSKYATLIINNKNCIFNLVLPDIRNKDQHSCTFYASPDPPKMTIYKTTSKNQNSWNSSKLSENKRRIEEMKADTYRS